MKQITDSEYYEWELTNKKLREEALLLEKERLANEAKLLEHWGEKLAGQFARIQAKTRFYMSSNPIIEDDGSFKIQFDDFTTNPNLNSVHRNNYNPFSIIIKGDVRKNTISFISPYHNNMWPIFDAGDKEGHVILKHYNFPLEEQCNDFIFEEWRPNAINLWKECVKYE